MSKKPDQEVHAWLQKASTILLSLDFDDAGKNRYPFWIKLYPNLRPWPAPLAKSIGDAFQRFNIDILRWVKAGLLSI